MRTVTDEIFQENDHGSFDSSNTVDTSAETDLGQKFITRQDIGVETFNPHRCAVCQTTVGAWRSKTGSQVVVCGATTPFPRAEEVIGSSPRCVCALVNQLRVM